MTFSEKMEHWVLEAVAACGGSAPIVQAAKAIWEAHEGDLKGAGDHFFTWQYEMRWAADRLRKKKKLSLRMEGSRSLWLLP